MDKNKFIKMISSIVITITMVAGMIPMLTLTTFAAATSSITSANFKAEDAKKYLAVYFTEPVCGDADCTAGLTVSNFSFTNGNAAGFASIASVNHTQGNNWALLTMDVASVAGDTADTINITEVYTPSGMLLENVTATSLTTDTTAPTVVTATSYLEKTGVDKDKFVVNFSEPVVNASGAALVNTDFTYVDDNAPDPDSGAFGDAAIHSTDRRWITFDTDSAILASDYADATDDGFDVADNKLYDLVGNEYGTVGTDVDFSTFTDISNAAPSISSAYGRIGADATGGNDLVFVTFNTPVFSAATASGNLVLSDFGHTLNAVDSATHVAGDVTAVVSLNANQTAMGGIDGDSGADDIYNAFGYALSAGSSVTVDDNTMPVLRGVWVNQYIDHASTVGTSVGAGTTSVATVTSEATVDYPQEGSKMARWFDNMLMVGDGFVGADMNVNLYDTTNSLYEFTQVKFDVYYEDNSHDVDMTANGDLQFIINDTADFTTASQWAITTDLSEKAWTTVTVDLTADITAGTALASQAADPQYWGIRVNGTTLFNDSDVIYVDNVRFSRGASSKSNEITLQYSEAVSLTGDPAEGASAASATTSGDMTTSKTLAGMGAFAAGTLTTKTLTNTVSKSADGSAYTIALADRSNGVITQATPVTLTGLFTPTANVTDIDANAIEVGSTHTPETIIDALDLTSAASAVTAFRISSALDSGLRLAWSSPAQTAATFSHYLVTYGTSASVSVASSLWGEADDSTLATSTVETVNLTGLTNGTLYYANMVAVDTKGNATALDTEKSDTPAGNSSSVSDSDAPGLATGLQVSITEDLEVLLTWVDAGDSDLNSVQVVRSSEALPDRAIIIDSVLPGVQRYTDTSVSEGDVMNYRLRGRDDSGNVGSYSDTVQITVEAAAEPVVTATAEEPAEKVEEVEAAEEATEEVVEELVEEVLAEETEVAEPVVPSFSDIADHWGGEAIVEMASKGVVKGDPDGNFRPNDDLNRAEAAAILYRVLGLEEPEVPSEKPFSDVAVDLWYSGYIASLKNLELVNGNPDGTYLPGKDINRVEFLHLALNAYYYISSDELRAEIDAHRSSESSLFEDVENGLWYSGTVRAAAALEIVEGAECGEGRCFMPTKNISRAEATKILFEMFGN